MIANSKPYITVARGRHSRAELSAANLNIAALDRSWRYLASLLPADRPGIQAPDVFLSSLGTRARQINSEAALG
jgi:hypothetical protein